MNPPWKCTSSFSRDVKYPGGNGNVTVTCAIFLFIFWHPFWFFFLFGGKVLSLTNACKVQFNTQAFCFTLCCKLIPWWESAPPLLHFTTQYCTWPVTRPGQLLRTREAGIGRSFFGEADCHVNGMTWHLMVPITLQQSYYVTYLFIADFFIVMYVYLYTSIPIQWWTTPSLAEEYNTR